MKRSIRFFAIGLLTSTILLFGYYFFFDKPDDLETISTEELIASVEADGYRVITEEEFISFSLYNEQDEEEEKSEDKSDKEKTSEDKDSNDDKKEKDNDKEKKEEKEEVKKVTFTTKEGVVSQDIADILIDNKVIDDRQKFLDYLDDNDYSGYIQVGKFEVTDDMTFKELAEIVTTYPGN